MTELFIGERRILNLNNVEKTVIITEIVKNPDCRNIVRYFYEDDSYGLINVMLEHEFINYSRQIIQKPKEKFWSLKYALDALEKGFDIQFGERLMSIDDVFHLFYIRVINSTVYDKIFKILPKKETVKKYPALYVEKYSGDIVLCMTEGKPSLYRNEKEFIDRFYDLKLSEPFCLIKEIPQSILDKFPNNSWVETIEINYEASMFGMDEK